MIIPIISGIKKFSNSHRLIKIIVINCAMKILSMMDVAVMATLKISIPLTVKKNITHTYLLISISPSYSTIPPCTRLV